MQGTGTPCPSGRPGSIPGPGVLHFYLKNRIYGFHSNNLFKVLILQSFMVETVSEETKFVRVDRIEDPRKYRFYGDGNDINSYLSTEHLRSKYNEIPQHLKGIFPNVNVQEFCEARLDRGEYTPASFYFKSGWDSLTLHQNNFVIVNGQIYSISSGGNYSGGDGRWSFSVRDAGNLSIVKNKLIEEASPRDGKLELSLSGDAPHHSNPPRRWRAWVDYEGTKPGELIEKVVEYINSEKERLQVPLWKQEVLV